MNKNEKKGTVWVYAVILFTSAFVVLLLTAYSQIKLNKNFTEYKRVEFSNREKEKSDFQLNLNNTKSENVNLKKTIDSLNSELAKMKEEKDSKARDIDEVQKKNSQVLSAYEILLAADNECRKGNIKDCAILLRDRLDPSQLGKEALNTYQDLVAATYKKAALILYEEGYEDYKNKLYDSARAKFGSSVNFAADEYFSDDCYYYMAYSEYRLGNKEAALNAINILLKNYPGSNFSEDAADLIKLIQGT